MVQYASFWKPKACGQTELPDRSVLIGQKLVENAKIQKFKGQKSSNCIEMYQKLKCKRGSLRSQCCQMRLFD